VPSGTRYEVPGWGSGELWTEGGVVLAHDFDLLPLSDTMQSAAVIASRGDLAPRDQAAARRRAEAAHGSGSISDDLLPRPLDDTRCLTPDALVTRFRAFLAGEPVAFHDVVLDLSWATPFQRALAEALRSVPRGEVVTYGELAALAGRPGAARAAGSFCAANRFWLIVPCHRVVAAGGVGGYGDAGVAVKRRLLALEGVVG